MNVQESVAARRRADRFIFFEGFATSDEDPHLAELAGSRSRLRPQDADFFPGDGLAAQFARALCAERAVPIKELLEAGEFFARVRRRVRRRTVVDLCSGHGLVGVLYALFEREVERVVLIDRRRPASWQAIVRAAAQVGSWVPPKLEYREQRLAALEGSSEPGAAFVGVHACGLRTDQVIDLAIASRGPVAVLPCCRPHRRHPAPLSLRNALGADLAIDIDRTYRLERAGWRARWDQIPGCITPMNRIVLGVPRAEGSFDSEGAAQSSTGSL